MQTENLFKGALILGVVGFVYFLINDAFLKSHIEGEQNKFVQGCIKGTPMDDIELYNKRLDGCKAAAEKIHPLPSRLKPTH